MRSRSQRSTLAAAVAFAGMLGAASASAGTLDVAPEATWSGDFGLALGLGDTDPAYVETDTPDDEVRYVVRFYFNADALSLSPGASLVLFRGLSEALAPIVTVRLQSDGGSGRELVYTAKTDAAETSTPDITVGSGWHLLELDWAAAAGPGANDGSLHTRLDDAPTAGLDLLDNDQSTIGVARWGAVAVAAAPSGTHVARRLRVASHRADRTDPGRVARPRRQWSAGAPHRRPTLPALFVRFHRRRADHRTLSAAAVGTAPPPRSSRGWWRCRRCSTSTTTARSMPLTDGLLVLRFLFGFTGTTLTSGAIGGGAARSTPVRWRPISTHWSRSGGPSMRRLTLITTGGTIEKVYDEGSGALVNRASQVRRMLAELRLEDTEISVLELMSKDSLEMSDADRRRILDAARLAGAEERDADGAGIVILHGTDTLAATGELLHRELRDVAVPIVLTGAIRPFEMKRSDALQNLTEALFATAVLGPGVYLVAHGRVLPFPGVRKDHATGTFVG